MPPKILATFVTTTTYGSWLPGDMRGYVQDGVILPPAPNLLAHAKSQLLKSPVILNPAQQLAIFHILRAAANEFEYRLTDVSMESWHVHWIIEHGFDPVAEMVGRLKTRMRQSLHMGRVWTEGFCHRCLDSDDEIQIARHYIARHAGARLINGELVERLAR